MIPAHRFLGMYVEKRSECGGCCPCCPTKVIYNFTLTGNEEKEFITKGKLDPADLEGESLGVHLQVDERVWYRR